MDTDIRRAASAIVARDGDEGIEVLVLERGDTSRFLPGYVAFPGGSIDAGDAALAERWFGSGDEAARACAVRELHEEVGLILSRDGLTEANGAELESIVASPPRPEQLSEVAHWIAPPQIPVRFDARFFAIDSPGGLRATPDGGEAAEAWWASPWGLLDEWEAGRRKLFWPTYFTVGAIAPCERVADLLALHIETREPDDEELERLPRSTFWQD